MSDLLVMLAVPIVWLFGYWVIGELILGHFLGRTHSRNSRRFRKHDR